MDAAPAPPAPVGTRPKSKKKETSRYANKTQWMALITDNGEEEDDDEDETFRRQLVKDQIVTTSA